jgi:hypothetical protein
MRGIFDVRPVVPKTVKKDNECVGAKMIGAMKREAGLKTSCK